MHKQEEMLFSFTLLPLGSGEHVAEPISEAVELIAASDLPYQVTGASTLIEGTWDQVMPLIERCIHEMTERHGRVYANLTIDHHAGASGRLKSSVEEVEKVLDHQVKKTP